MIDKKIVTKHSNFHWSIYTEVEIDAPKEKVWSVLTDFQQMPQWSKTLQNIEGSLTNGTKTKVVYIFKGKSRVIHHTMVDFEDGTQFGWSDTLIPFAKDRHIYRVEAISDSRSRFVQTDEVKGPTALLVSGMLMAEMSKTYPIFNEALKAIVENK